MGFLGRKNRRAGFSKWDVGHPSDVRLTETSHSPKVAMHDVAPVSGAQPESGTFRKVRSRSKPLIVFADDSAICTLQMLSLLGGAGYDVITTSNGRGAVRLTREHRPDLVLLDVEMPELGGVDACEMLKRDPELARIPVVLMTAHDDPRHLRDGFRSGCDGYIAKGTPDEDVLRKLALKLLPGTSIQSK